MNPDDNVSELESEEPTEAQTEAERQAEERYQARAAELRKEHEADMQRVIEEVIADERRREDSAMRELRDLKVRTGLDVNGLREAHRNSEIERLQYEEGVTESYARETVLAKEKVALLEAQEADRQREHEESASKAKYRAQKLEFLADPKQPDVYKKTLRQFGAEIDAFSDHGRAVAFEVALKFVAGQHLAEIQAAVHKEIEEAHHKGKGAPGRGTPQAEALTAAEVKTALAFGLTPERYAQAKAGLNKPKGLPQRDLDDLAIKFGLDPKEVAQKRAERRK